MTCDLVSKQRALSSEDSQQTGPAKMVWAIRLLVNSVVAGTLVGVGFLTRFLLQQQQVGEVGFYYTVSTIAAAGRRSRFLLHGFYYSNSRCDSPPLSVLASVSKVVD